MPDQPAAEPIARRVVVSGRVQGVGFRFSAQDHAKSIGCLGWVRNLPDGDVEVWAEGPADVVEAMISWLREGPAWARVEDLQITSETPEGHSRFQISR